MEMLTPLYKDDGKISNALGKTETEFEFYLRYASMN